MVPALRAPWQHGESEHTVHISASEMRSSACTMRHALDRGQLLGFRLKRRTPALRLQEGTIIGRALAVFHQAGPRRLDRARFALARSFVAERRRIRVDGGVPPGRDVFERLVEILENYASVAKPLASSADTFGLVEEKLEAAIPGVPFVTALGFIDGAIQHHDGSITVVDFKLRGQFSAYEDIQRDNQFRIYQWLGRQCGLQVRGCIVEEVLNDVASPVRLNKNGSVSKVQSCLSGAYADACRVAGHEPDDKVFNQLFEKAWYQRTSVFLTDRDLEMVEQDLVGAARFRVAAEMGVVTPFRNPGKDCRWCQFRDICADPWDEALVDALFVRKPRLS